MSIYAIIAIIALLSLVHNRYTVISINVVRSQPEAYERGLNGGLGIHWNFAYWATGNVHVCSFAREKFVFTFKRHQ